jgi:hypothetical protein
MSPEMLTLIFLKTKILVNKAIYREDFKSLDEFTALRFTATGAPLAVRCIRILPMNQLIMFGMK